MQKVDDLAKELFGNMRTSTKEERDALNSCLDDVFVSTGIKPFEIGVAQFLKINSKDELINILKERNIDYQYISFVNAKGEQDFVYMVRYENDFYAEDAVGGFISYNKEKTWSREDIEEAKNDMGLVEIFNDGVLYELDVYPVFKDFVEYPITNVEFLDEEGMLKKLCETKTKSFYDSLMK